MRLGALILAVVAAGCSWSPRLDLPYSEARPRPEPLSEAAAGPAGESAESPLGPLDPGSPGAIRTPRREVEDEGVLTLAGAFRLALAHSEGLKIQGERILEAETQRRQAIARLLPQIVAHGRYTRDSQAVEFAGMPFTPESRFDSWLTLRQTLFEGSVYPALDIAKETRRIEELRLLDARDRLLFEVAAIFYEILSLEEDRAALTTSLARSQEHVRVLGVRFRVGEVPEQDVLLAQARLDETQAREIRTQYDLERARSRLSRVIGRVPLPPVLKDTFEVVKTESDIPRLADEALKQRLDLLIAQIQTRQAQAQKRAAASEYLPRAALDFSHWTDIQGGFTEGIDWTLGISLDWTVFDGGNREARVAQALSAVRQRKLAVAQLEKDIQLEVEDSVLAFRSLDRSLAAFESRERAATRSQEQIEQFFRAGEATNLDVLFAEEAREEAQRDLARSRLARKLAALRIRLALGDFHRVVEIEEES